MNDMVPLTIYLISSVLVVGLGVERRPTDLDGPLPTCNNIMRQLTFDVEWR